MPRGTSRRDFLKQSTSAGVAFWVAGQSVTAHGRSPNEKLNIAAVGVGRRGWINLQGVRSENIVALCDVDQQFLARAKGEFPQAKTYADWRKMLDDPSIDAVVVSTPDHTHAAAGLAAMKSGRHLYCEKPLARSLYESRRMADTATQMGIVTQMGNQGHASDRLRRIVEFVRSGGLGTVREAVGWSGKTSRFLSPGDRPTETAPVPEHLSWNLWLGPAPERPYHPSAYHPRSWRGWWDFGVGNFADMSCHLWDAPFWALDLDYPETVSAEGPPPHPESAPPWLIVRLEFPARGDRPGVKLTWYDGTRAPPSHLLPGVELSQSGTLFIGETGRLFLPHGRGEGQLVVEGETVPIRYPDPSLPRPQSHYAEWIEACKTGGRTFSDFNYGSRLTDAALAGIVAYRTGTTLQWDGKQMKADNCPQADPFICPEFRNGWGL